MTATRGHYGRVSSADERSDGRLRVLHLGFEDPLMPGAGGGSVRTHEINRRLVAAGIDITVLTTRYQGCAERVQDGVSYLPVGVGAGTSRWGRLVGYTLGLPPAVRRHRAVDLIVEDFFAPFSSMAAPYWTRLPTIGVVQWLHAKQKSREYKLPLHLIERLGVRSHSRLIAVSVGTASQLQHINPSVRIDVIGNGVDSEMFRPEPRLGRDIVYVGRLELHGKGLDLLLHAWQRATLGSRSRLVLAGTGPDEAKVRQLALDLGIAEQIKFAGWVSGQTKRQLLNEARLVVVPSRHETFGIVAVEALAAATPVLAFDIPCLREVIPTDCGVRVRAYDIDAFAHELMELHDANDVLQAAGLRGRKFAAKFNWDVLAAKQAKVYREAANFATDVGKN